MRKRTEYSQVWLEALEAATTCLRSRSPKSVGGEGGHHHVDLTDYDCCLSFLDQLETSLVKKIKGRWNSAPSHPPPSWEEHCSYNGKGGETPELLVPSMLIHTSQQPPHRQQQQPVTASSNPFELFAEGDDDDDSDSDETEQTQNEEEEEAGDTILLYAYRKDEFNKRRILIRIRTSQSEVYAAKANVFRRHAYEQWAEGAGQYGRSLERIHAALELADTEISRWFSSSASSSEQQHQNHSAAMESSKKALQEDADIVAVAIGFLTSERERYLQAAQQQERYLVRKLQPQWTSRDEVKRSMGDRWYKNPSPKQDYAALRAEAEQRLRDIREALEQLENLDVADLERSSQAMKELLGGKSVERNPSRRYNGVRPALGALTKRVDTQLYPDPTEFGWTFTGSWITTEFFEKDGVKLDWYFTTGTVKTSMEHPVQGKTQMFGAKVEPATYQDILLDPRTHTGKRYQRKR